MELNLPSPIQRIDDPLFAEKELQVYVKRDDLIHPQISGNKWRKLKYIIQKAESQGKTRLVTFGGAFSNHLLATAAAAYHLNFRTTGIVRGKEADNDILHACKKFGMQLIFIDREIFLDKRSFFDLNFSDDPQAFFIDEGGASPEAVLGCRELVEELSENYDHIFCSAGTGTTAAGILMGIENLKLSTMLHVVPALKGGEGLKLEMEKYVSTNQNLKFHLDYHFGGYAKSDTKLLEFIIDFYYKNGILLDPVYTGKMLFGLYDLIRTDKFMPGDKILWIHTGGLMGLMGMKEKFQEINPGFRQLFEEFCKNNYQQLNNF